MNRLLITAGAAGVYLTIGVGVSAQTCREDIPATAPDERFTDNGDGTVTDAATGLMWKQCAEGYSGAGCLTGAARAFTWNEALQSAAGAGEFSGYSDWRLPNIKELESLLEYRCIIPAINAAYFPRTPPNGYWSSSPGAFAPISAWLVDFGYGGVGYGYKGDTFRVRLVRAGE